jgi:hypothetical protein
VQVDNTPAFDATISVVVLRSSQLYASGPDERILVLKILRLPFLLIEKLMQLIFPLFT